MKKGIVDWMVRSQDEIMRWLETVQHPGKPWGLFKHCADSKIPFCLPATAIGLSDASLCGGLEKLPGYHINTLDKLGEYVQQFQDPKTGQFIDPHLDACFVDRSNERELHNFRAAVTNYAIILLNHCRKKPLYPYSSSGEKGQFDPACYLAYMKNGDWDRPWGVGSHAGYQTMELFRFLNEGHQEYIPVLREGIEFILSKQNPQTGMWGRESLPVDEQIGGTLKIIGRFQWGMGLIVPHLDRLADSCIKHHHNRAFYHEDACASVPRNVAEIVYACMEVSDYRKDELQQVMVEIAGELQRYHQSDGGFAYSKDGKQPVAWCGAVVAGESKIPRSDVHGVQNAFGCMINIYHWMGWTGGFWRRPQHWREKLSNNKYLVFAAENGKVQIEPK